MTQLLRSSFICLLLLSVPAFGYQSVFKVLEQDEDGNTTHYALDRSSIGDGLDPVLQFIVLEEPTDPQIAQVLWEASEKPIPWARTAEEVPYRMIESAVLPPDSVVEYRIFVAGTDDELTSLRHTRSQDDGSYAVDSQVISDLPDGEYNIHAHLLIPNRPNALLTQRIQVSDLGEAEEDVDPQQDDTPALEPGDGWDDEQESLEPVGDPDHPGFKYSAIARWAVVPHQTFDGEFTIGVSAFHSYDIDRVEFSVDGGQWVSVDEMATNPRTQAEEYFINLQADSFNDGKVVVRAIAYPYHGVPRVLEDLELFANAGGSLSFPVIELDAGEHKLSGLSEHMPEQGWLTVRPKPGVAKEDCIVTEIDRVYSDRRVKIQGVTITHNGGNDFLYGLNKKSGWVWLDDVKVVGNGRAHMTAWLVHLWGKQFYTDCDISKVQNVFHGGGGELFARNINIHDTYEDVFRAFGYIANVTIDGVDRGDTNFHPDIFELTVRWPQRNLIFHNIKVRNAGAQGMAGGLIRDVAMVNVDIETHGKAVMQIGMELTNVLIQDSRFAGGARLRDAEPNGFVIRDSVIGWREPFLPDGWDQPGVEVLNHAFELNR